MTAELTADASSERSAVIEQAVTEDADPGSGEPQMSAARAGAILIFWFVSFVLFFLGIKRLLQFWAVALVLASLRILMTIEDVLMAIVVFVLMLGTLVWMGVREIFGCRNG